MPIPSGVNQIARRKYGSAAALAAHGSANRLQAVVSTKALNHSLHKTFYTPLGVDR
jgi:hypothetical protein